MESYAATCRFHPLLQLLFAHYRPYPEQVRHIPVQEPFARRHRKEISRIAKNEGLRVAKEAMDAIVDIAQGDMRKAINALQGAAILSSDITAEMVYAITATARPEEIEDLLSTALSGNFEGATAILHHLLDDRGIAPNELINQCYRALTRRTMDPDIRVGLIDELGTAEFPTLGRRKYRHPVGGNDSQLRPLGTQEMKRESRFQTRMSMQTSSIATLTGAGSSRAGTGNNSRNSHVSTHTGVRSR